MTVAGLAAWLCQRWGLSAIVGYLGAGMLVGPFAPPFALVKDLDRVEALAQLGLVLVIFFIGLSLNLNRLKRLGFSLVAAAAVSALLILNSCRLIGWALGWTPLASLFLAGMLMVSSSAIIAKALEEQRLSYERSGQLALGMTIMEDVVAVAMMAALTSMIKLGGGGQPPPVLATLGAVAAFVILIGLVALLLAPRLLLRLNRKTQPEIRTLVISGMLLSLASVAVQLGYSLALGAFVFGTILGSTQYKADIERAFAGVRHIFGAVFFVAVGMQVDVNLLLKSWPVVLSVTGLAFTLRPLACSLGFLAAGHPSREAVQAGLTLAPLGEFSFIIAQLGMNHGVVPESTYAVAVGASLLTALGAPWLTRRAGPWSQRIIDRTPRLFQNWLGYYHNGLAHVRSIYSASIIWRLVKGRLAMSLLQLSFVSAMLVFATPLYQKIRVETPLSKLFPNGFPFVYWGTLGLVAIMPLVALWRNVSALVKIFAESATHGIARQPILQPLLEYALQTVAGVVLVSWLLTLLPARWSLIGVAGAVILLLILVTWFFRQRLEQMHTRLELELLEQLKLASSATATSAWSSTLQEHTNDWALDIIEVVLPNETVLGGKTIREAALRQHCGCSLIGIDRQGFGLINPAAEMVLYPRDKLLLLGTVEQLAKAVKILGQVAPEPESMCFDDLTMGTVLVPENSHLLDQPLLELDLIHKLRIQIGAIRRQGEMNTIPNGQTRLHGGDQLLVLGTHAQIKAFRQLLARKR